MSRLPLSWLLLRHFSPHILHRNRLEEVEQVGAFDPDKLSSFLIIGGSFLSGRMAYCVLPNEFSAHMTSIVHDPVHRADVRRDHSIHPERLRVDRPRGGEALQYLETVSGMLSSQPHRLGVCGFQRRVFDSRVRSANAEDVVVWFHGISV